MITVRAFLLALLISSSSVYAQFAQTYVSAETGNDSHSCEFSHPCRTITRAISQTNPRGDVIILDSGPYDPFVVGKTLTVTAAPGVQPTITVTAGSGALITAGAEDSVTLRGLAFNAVLAFAGIRFVSGNALLVESCSIHGSNRGGITVEGSGKVFIKDTNIQNCFSLDDAGSGIYISPPTGTVMVTIEHCRLENNWEAGVEAYDNSKVTVRDTVSSGNAGAGFRVFSHPAPVEMNLENCAATDNSIGVNSAIPSTGGSATIRVSGSVITNNDTGIFANLGGVVLSRGNNTLEGNQADGSFTALYLAK